MDRTVKLLLDKVTQLTTRFNSLTQNSKKIHELPNAVSKENVHIAVSDGTNTGKIIYEPNEVSAEDFENIVNMTLGSDAVTSTIFLKKANGDVITTLDVSFLNGNNVKLNIDPVTQSLQLLNFDDKVVSAVPLSEMFPAIALKQIFTHDIAEIDLADPAKITLQLQTVPNQNEWYDLHINGGFVNDDSYQIHNTELIIDRTKISYPITTGKKITFRYRRA